MLLAEAAALLRRRGSAHDSRSSFELRHSQKAARLCAALALARPSSGTGAQTAVEGRIKLAGNAYAIHTGITLSLIRAPGRRLTRVVLVADRIGDLVHEPQLAGLHDLPETLSVHVLGECVGQLVVRGHPPEARAVENVIRAILGLKIHHLS